MMYLGIDPGSSQTAYALVDSDYQVIDADKVDNRNMREFLRNVPVDTEVVIEGIQAYGMAVGRSVFDTCYEIGRLMEICELRSIVYRIYNRPEYAKAICGVMKVNDSILRQALILRFGGDKKGEPLYKLKGNSDKRSAFAIACYHMDLMRLNRAASF
jgi:Holliday junction resolvasome RuvABC endonuclease subunit